MWLATARGTGSEVPRRLVVDDTGSSYIVGWFNSTNVSFGNGVAITNTLKSGFPPMDSFVAKFDPNGAAVWAQKFGGTDDDRAPGIAVDAQHNCYVAGSFGSSNFFIGDLTLTNSSPAGNTSFYVARFDASGNLLWSRGPDRGGYSQGAAAIALDGAGNIYALLGVSGTNSIGGTNIVSRGFTDVLLIKYDANGNLLWLRQGGGTGNDSASALTVDAAGAVYAAASFTSATADFGGVVLTNKGTLGSDIAVVKYDPAGNLLWARGFGGESGDGATGVALDSQGNCYVTGAFNSTNMVFGNIHVSLNSFPSVSDIFTAKLNSDGDALWVETAGGAGLDSGQAIAVDLAGNSYVAGWFESAYLHFDATTLTNSAFPIDWDSSADGFVAKYDPNGHLLWALRPFGADEQRCFSIAVDSLANVLVTGWTQGTNVLFGSLATTNAHLDLFVARIEADTPLLQIDRADGVVVVSWPTRPAGFAPEFTTDYLNWTPAVGSIATNNNRVFLTNVITGAQGFIRLKKPL